MKSSELRIGNYVDVVNRSNEVHLPFNTIRKVGGIELFKVSLHEHDKPFIIQSGHWEVDLKDLCPIPITEDWLLRFEFKREKLGGFKKSPISIKLNEDSSFKGNIWIHVEWMSSLQVRYIHELQNLYFSLTSKELQIHGTDARALDVC
jgi:hypothetical protein